MNAQQESNYHGSHLRHLNPEVQMRNGQYSGRLLNSLIRTNAAGKTIFSPLLAKLYKHE